MNADILYHRGFKPLLEKAGLSSFAFHSLPHLFLRHYRDSFTEGSSPVANSSKREIQ